MIGNVLNVDDGGTENGEFYIYKISWLKENDSIKPHRYRSQLKEIKKYMYVMDLFLRI